MLQGVDILLPKQMAEIWSSAKGKRQAPEVVSAAEGRKVGRYPRAVSECPAPSGRLQL